MERIINTSKIFLTIGDITKESTDAIVNAANSRLAGGGGVDGAIHCTGGPAIMQQCRKIGGCPTGKAVITTAGALKAHYVIHAVGPRYNDGTHQEAALLKSAYLESLTLASARNLTSISFPAISTGAYGYPLKEAAHIALHTVIEYLKDNQDIHLVRFVLYNQATYTIFASELQQIQ
ncbi:MAG: O-acetyl-ADP-ribose deacetylase [Candidatus Thermoplasmatota archaeon]|nr:O-acetyl-ADP-ribose deacetylase [Candidatus Thermoplasmatota archaeon]